MTHQTFELARRHGVSNSLLLFYSCEKIGVWTVEIVSNNRIFGGKTRENHRVLHKACCRAASSTRMERVVL